MSKKPKITPRKPPAAAAASFIAGAREPHGHGGSKSTTYVRKADATELARVTVYLPKELFKRAKVRAVESEMPLSAFVADLLERSL